MATLNVGRSLRNLFVLTLVVGSLATACKQSGSGSDVDPRDQYVGVYEGGERSYQSVLTIGTFPTEEAGATTIDVSKGASPKELYLNVSNRIGRVTVELNGADFRVVDRTRDQMTVNINGRSNVLEGAFTATGAFDKDQATGKNIIAINAVTETTQFGTTVRRTETIVGTRK